MFSKNEAEETVPGWKQSRNYLPSLLMNSGPNARRQLNIEFQPIEIASEYVNSLQSLFSSANVILANNFGQEVLWWIAARSHEVYKGSFCHEHLFLLPPLKVAILFAGARPAGVIPQCQARPV